MCDKNDVNEKKCKVLQCNLLSDVRLLRVQSLALYLVAPEELRGGPGSGSALSPAVADQIQDDPAVLVLVPCAHCRRRCAQAKRPSNPGGGDTHGSARLVPVQSSGSTGPDDDNSCPQPSVKVLLGVFSCCARASSLQASDVIENTTIDSYN